MKFRRRIFLKCVFYIAASALIIYCAGLVFVSYIKANFRQIANDWMIDQNIKAEIDYESIHFGGLHSVTFKGVTIYPKNMKDKPIIEIASLRFRYTIFKLLKKRMELISIESPRFRLAKEIDQVIDLQHDVAAADPAAPKIKPWFVEKMRVSDGSIHLDDLGDAIPPVVFDFETSMDNVWLGDNEEEDEPIAVAYIRRLKIYSPWDLFTPVLDFPEIKIRYRVSNLLRKKLDGLDILTPIIYIGEDLFWLSNYADNMNKKRPTNQKKNIPWTIGEFRVVDGKIGLQYFGKMQFMLPLKFQANSENIMVGSFDNLQLKTSFVFEKSSFYYPEYNLSIEDVEGSLDFSMPPNVEADNIVQVVKVRGFRWKDFTAKDLWVSVTFDAKGIYLEFGGNSYGGYLNGAGDLSLKGVLPWNASLAVSKIDLGSLTKSVAVDRFIMTGKANLKTVVKAEGKYVKEVKGSLLLANSGKMTIPALEAFLPKIEQEKWDQIRKDLAEIFVRSFSDYHYTHGSLLFDYTPKGGKIDLKMDGDGGKRNISIILKEDVFNQKITK